MITTLFNGMISKDKTDRNDTKARAKSSYNRVAIEESLHGISVFCWRLITLFLTKANDQLT